MLFTIAIPTFNGAKVVKQAIQSALNQNYKQEYEIVIVDNASTDDTFDVINTFSDPKIRVIQNKETVDLFGNHNICFKEAQGDYLLFCHSDDQLKPDALNILEKEIRLLGKPSKLIIWGRSMYRDHLYAFSAINYKIGETISGENAIKAFASAGGLTPSGTCYSRKSICELGLFPKMNNKITPYDWYILIIAAFNGFEFKMIDRLLYIRKAATTATNSIPFNYSIEAYAYSFKKTIEKLDENDKKRLIEVMYLYGNPFAFNYLRHYLPIKKKVIYYLRAIKKTGLLTFVFHNHGKLK